MAFQKNQNDQERSCIQLIRCVTPTLEERNDPQYIPQLEINKEAQQIIAQRFEIPISIIVYVGNMGVGKSKLATVTVAALEKERHDPSLNTFRSGAGSNGVTQGVWMWCEPLLYYDEKEKKSGSVMILDCEGMGDLDENTGANLYLFCMVISTAFSVVLRPPRIDKSQCDRLFHALCRFEGMKTQHVLPNFWLTPIDLPDFVHSDPNTGDDKIITKEQWINNIFSIDEEHNRLSNFENQQLKTRYEYIKRMLPKIDAVSIDHLPRSLTKNAQNLDVHSLLRKEESVAYLESVYTAIRVLLASGGKRFPGSNANKMFVRPAELASFMGELIDVINRDKIPNPDLLFERHLANRFTAEIEIESLAKFKNDLMWYAKEMLEKTLYRLKRPLTDAEIAETDEEMKQEHVKIKTTYMDAIIRRARYEIVGVDQSLRRDFKDDKERQTAVRQLPLSIQHRLTIVETQMNDYQEPQHFIRQGQYNLSIADARRQTAEKQKLLDEAHQKLNELTRKAHQEALINESLDKAEPWRVGVAPCSCGARGGAYNMLHTNCTSNNAGNLYYFNNENNRMVCDACRKIIRCQPDDARCIECEKHVRVTRVF